MGDIVSRKFTSKLLSGSEKVEKYSPSCLVCSMLPSIVAVKIALMRICGEDVYR